MLRIKELCKEKGIALQTLAEKRLGITNQALYASINGNPTLERLQQIATALEVDVTELFSPKGDGFMAVVDYDGKLRRFDSIGALKAFIGEIEENKN